MTNTYFLEPRFDSAKSFYRKASVIINYTQDQGMLLSLKSYDTIVATIKVKDGQNVCKVNGTYSATTLRHIKEFLRQNGFKAETKKQIIEMYC